MKKINLFVVAFLLATLTFASCSSTDLLANDESVARLPASADSPAVNTFRQEFVYNIKVKSLIENDAGRTAELEAANAKMTKASKVFLKANGISLTNFDNNDKDSQEIRRIAIALFAKQTAIISNN